MPRYTFWHIRQARPYVFGRKFTVVTDHCGLCYLMKAKDLNSRLARWSLELAEYDFKIVYNSGRVHGDADSHVEANQPLR